ncbi:muscarinic acetylcholine receptor [Plakobranchus ocellatus]|uniref:Muscarinic acetylcholine receptor n=1 Tax=Plakobranchus ocellatus TaxID=259542 RepID=A0AAV4B296_9GAST|nr:muscarinic acetylcholine receptor [Plakobranchus ocellatus]
MIGGNNSHFESIDVYHKQRMNLSANLAAARADAVEIAQKRDITLLFFMGSLSVVGIVVNSLLLDVYLHTRRKVLSTYFISALAAMDLIISAVVIPLRMMLVLKAVPAVVCGLCLSVSYACSGVSIMLFFCITFDRYQAVCLLQRPLITHQTLHFVAGWAFVSAAYAGIIAPIYLKGEITVKDEWPNLTGNQSDLFVREVTFFMREGYPCYSTSMLSSSDRVWDARFNVQFGFAVCCGSLIVLVLVLYFFMFLTLRQKDQFRLQSMLSRPPRQATKELRARPCCDLESISAISVVKAVQGSNDDEENIEAGKSNNSLNSTEKHQSKNDSSTSTAKTGLETGSSKLSIIAPRCRKQLDSNMNRTVKVDNNKNQEYLPAERMIMPSSYGQSIDLFKLRKRLNGKVEPLPEHKDGPMKEIIAGNNRPKENLCQRSAKIVLKKSIRTKGKHCRTSLLATTLACFTNNAKSTKQGRVSGQFDLQAEPSTDGTQSDPELSCCHPNPTHPASQQNSCEKIDNSSDNVENENCSNESLNGFNISLRPRSYSCSAAESRARNTNRGRVFIETNVNKKCEENVTTSAKSFEKPQNTTKDTKEENQTNPNLKKIKKKSIELDEIDIKNKNTKHFKATIEHSLSLSFQTLDESSSDQGDMSGKSFYSNGSASEIMTVKSPVLQVTIVSKSHQNSGDAGSKPCTAKSLEGFEQRMDGKETVHKTNSTDTRDCTDTVDTNMANRKGSRRLSISRRKCVLERVSTCFQWSLSIRVTARLCLLTLTYCLWWLPFYLTELGLVDYQTLMPEIMFMANVMNPLLHLLTSPIFRLQAKARIQVYLRLLASKCRPKSLNK